ncbi:MAG: hypothetical protein NZM07_10200 [Elioraea sp.]|nr:hypothetical protein [Elioraea sp.]
MIDFLDRLRREGAAYLTDLQGRHICVARGGVFGLEEPSLVIAYEGEGTIVLRDRVPRNIFTLIAAGFSGPAAKVVFELVSQIVTQVLVDQESTVEE